MYNNVGAVKITAAGIICSDLKILAHMLCTSEERLSCQLQ